MRLALRIRYSLLTAAVFLSLLCIAFGFWANRAHRQRNAVRLLRDAGSIVKYSDQMKVRYDEASGKFYFERPDVRLVSLDEHSWWRDFVFEVVVVDASHAPAFSDVEMSLLSELPMVQAINLQSTNITSRGVTFLRKCPALTRVDLAHTAVGDLSLNYIAELKNLRYLQLYDTQVSNDGLVNLWGHVNLRAVDVTYTQVSEAGANQLRRKLPRCKVVFIPRTPVSALRQYSPTEEVAVIHGVDAGRNFLPDRSLTPDELSFLLEKSNLLIHKPRADEFASNQQIKMYNVDRRLAAKDLGEQIAHRCIIPVLAAVLRDSSDDPAVRAAAANALKRVAEPLAVEILIETIPEGDGVGLAAEFGLIHMIGVGVGRKNGDGYVELPLDQRIERQAQWRKWWEKNRDRFVLRGPFGSMEVFMSEEQWEKHLQKRQ